MPTSLAISLTIGSALLVTNIWLMLRCGKVRSQAGISIGDGGNDLLARRMRAHSNFIESAPLVLIMIAIVEFTVGQQMWLWVIGSAYVVARILHGLGMDGGKLEMGRMVGTLGSLLIQIALAGAALYQLYGSAF